MKRIAFILFGLGLFSFVQVPAHAVYPDSLRIVVLGSSTASATGASVPDSGWVWRYTAYLATEYPGSEVINLAVGGYTTYHIQSRHFRAPEKRPEPDTIRNISTAITLRPSAIIINLPSNDAARNIPLSERIANLVRVANHAARFGIPLWICTSQPRNMSDTRRRDLLAMRDFTLETFEKNALDFWSPLATRAGRIRRKFDSGDGVHLNDAGHRVLFGVVRKARIPEQLRAPGTLPHMYSRPSLRALPNPARDFVTFRIHTVHPGGYSIRIIDLFGKEVQRYNGTGAPGVFLRFFPTASLHRGVYHVYLRNGPADLSIPLYIKR